jgi:hypothetical protein
MTISTGTPDRLESCLSWLLNLGIWTSCGLIAAGMMLPVLGVSAGNLVKVGIVLLIALPTIRVTTMSIWFLLYRDFDFALIAALVRCDHGHLVHPHSHHRRPRLRGGVTTSFGADKLFCRSPVLQDPQYVQRIRAFPVIDAGVGEQNHTVPADDIRR